MTNLPHSATSESLAVANSVPFDLYSETTSVPLLEALCIGHEGYC